MEGHTRMERGALPFALMSIPPPPPPSGPIPPPPGSVPPPPGYQAPGAPAPGFPAAGYQTPGGSQLPPGYQGYGQAAPNYAGVGSRFGALIIDGLIGALFALPAIIALFAGPREIGACTINGEPRLCNLPTGATVGLTVLLAVVGSVAYLVLYCRKVGTSGQSWGGKVVGNKIVDVNTGQPIGVGKALGRTLFRSFISSNVCLLGYLWALWDPKKQTWHDKVVNSIVVKA